MGQLSMRSVRAVRMMTCHHASAWPIGQSVRETTEMVVGALGRPHTHPLAQHHHGWLGAKDVPALKEPVLVEHN